MQTKIIIAMHKPYKTPEESVYLPLQVGAEGKDSILGLVCDNTGENISAKNPTYCELTGLYWAWKNLDADAIGLVHYRRYFTGKSRSYRKAHANNLMDCVLTTAEAGDLMEAYDIVVPTKRKYYIESLYSHYAHTLDAKHLDLAQEIIHSKCPEYDAACKKVYASTWGYMFNMCIMRRTYLDAYCKWLFPILADLEDAMQDDLKSMSAFEARLFGRVSEILFNVWLLKEEESKDAPCVKEVATMHMEPVNWLKKGGAFLKAKFFGKKYGASF